MVASCTSFVYVKIQKDFFISLYQEIRLNQIISGGSDDARHILKFVLNQRRVNAIPDVTPYLSSRWHVQPIFWLVLICALMPKIYMKEANQRQLHLHFVNESCHFHHLG